MLDFNININSFIFLIINCKRHFVIAKMSMPYSQWYPWNFYLINNVEDIVVLLGFKRLILVIPICFPIVEMHKEGGSLFKFQT